MMKFRPVTSAMYLTERLQIRVDEVHHHGVGASMITGGF
jgi:hypothetical protein